MTIKIKTKPVDIVIVQVYAPTSEAQEEEIEDFYEELAHAIHTDKKNGDCLIVMGDLNGKVGKGKDDDIVGPFGLGDRNENGQCVIDCCRRHNLMVANTWFQARANATYTWTAPNGDVKNQIDYILVDKRFRST